MMQTSTVEIAKLELHAGDTVVVRTEAILTKVQVETIHERLKPMIPDDVGIIVLTGGMTLEILRRGDDAEAAAQS